MGLVDDLRSWADTEDRDPHVDQEDPYICITTDLVRQVADRIEHLETALRSIQGYTEPRGLPTTSSLLSEIAREALGDSNAE